MSNHKELFAKDLDEWQKQVRTVAFIHTCIEVNGEKYVAEEEENILDTAIKALAMAYHELVLNGGDLIDIENRDALKAHQFRGSLSLVYDEYIKATIRTKQLLKEYLKEVEDDDGRETASSSERPKKSGGED